MMHSITSRFSRISVSGDDIHQVSEFQSEEFSLFCNSIRDCCVVGLDAEWKPVNNHQNSSHCSSPRVSILQIACLLLHHSDKDCSSYSSSMKSYDADDGLYCRIFILDLFSLPPPSVVPPLTELFSSPKVLKLGFKFKQDLFHLSSPLSLGIAFDKVEPYIDIGTIYDILQTKRLGAYPVKESKSLAFICKEVLGIHLSKELQCSDWSCRPLTEQQLLYAAADAHCLLEIFISFEHWLHKQGNTKPSMPNFSGLNSVLPVGLILALTNDDHNQNLCWPKFPSVDVVKSTISRIPGTISVADSAVSCPSNRTIRFLDSVSKIVQLYGEQLRWKESNGTKSVKRKGKRRDTTQVSSVEELEEDYNWQGPAPWDLSFGGNGCPKFLCDVMVEGLAKQLRAVGVDAETPTRKKPEVRQLIEVVDKENRVLLTRDRKLLRCKYLSRNQVYLVKSLVKEDQLIEVIKAFQLMISEDELMTRCIKCNGKFLQKPLTANEAVEAAKGMQVIPSCVAHPDSEFWQCERCSQLYWEGTQYHNAVEKFTNICKLKLDPSLS